jgi:nitrogen fixation/metabolism regulation signal transduction histidine kinase
MLYNQFEEINQQVNRLRENYLSTSQYFQTMLDHVGTGILSFYNTGKIDFVNKMARDYLGLKNLTNLNEIDKLDPNMTESLLEIRPGEQKLVKFVRDNTLINLALRATELISDNKKIKIISLQNISLELEEHELDSWQKLIRVLTHEIMNSIAPITSSIETMKVLYTHPVTNNPRRPEEIDEETILHTIKGLAIIGERSLGLLEFVKHYRKLTLLPQPTFDRIELSELCSSIKLLLNDTIVKEGFNLTCKVPEGHTIKADKKLLEQVLINLIMNAIDAADKPDKKISMEAEGTPEGKTLIRVMDNGRGIPPEIVDQIFMPFYSTKERGTGIGLSLSRQILRVHQGNIAVNSEPGVGSTFTITL